MGKDYLLKYGDKAVFLEAEQKEVRTDVIGKFKACRKGKKLTQSQLAERTGISQPNITRFESCNYNPSLEMMVRIASAMDMKLDIKLVDKEK